MKEHGNKHPAEPATKTLKSLLKKPGQTKTKSQKHRVVINEKLNEFFAADYIILIKEECCADYEEDCDCCFQEHEFMRLGNCKECRAELNLHFGITDNSRYGELARVEQTLCENTVRDRGRRKDQHGCVESQTEEDEEEDEEEVDDEVEEEETKDEENEEENADRKEEKVATEGKETNERGNVVEEDMKRRPKETDSQEKNGTMVPPPQHGQQQQETLSPPEGYKDVYSNNEMPNEMELHTSPTCAECNYYQQQATGELNSLSCSTNFVIFPISF